MCPQDDPGYTRRESLSNFCTFCISTIMYIIGCAGVYTATQSNELLVVGVCTHMLSSCALTVAIVTVEHFEAQAFSSRMALKRSTEMNYYSASL